MTSWSIERRSELSGGWFPVHGVTGLCSLPRDLATFPSDEGALIYARRLSAGIYRLKKSEVKVYAPFEVLKES